MFGFRLVVPRDLQAVLPFAEHRLSLKTPALSVAKTLAYILGFYVHRRMALIRAMSPEQAQADGGRFIPDLASERDRISRAFEAITQRRKEIKISADAVAERLRQMLILGLDGELRSQVDLPAALLPLLGRVEEDDPFTMLELGTSALTAELQSLNVEDADLQRQLAELAGDSTLLVQDVRHQDGMAAATAAHEVEKQTLADFTAMMVASSAGRVHDHSPGRMSIDAVRQIQGLDVEGGKKSITQFFAMYCESHRNEWKNWGDRVQRDYNPLRDTLIVLFGDLPIEQLTVAHSRQITEHFKAITATKGGKLTTAQKKVDFVRAAFAWGKQQTMLPDLTGPLRIDADAASYEAFTSGELRTMFECDEYRLNSFSRSSKFWLPLLGLYTGGRIEELASLRAAQVSEAGGVSGLLLSPGGKATGKNSFSRRFVPLHSELIRCGFLNYTEIIRSDGHEFLFPCTPVAARDGRGKAAGRDFQVFRRNLGIGASLGAGRGTKVFHSFRATLTTAMQSAGVPQEVREVIIGHAKSGVHAQVYSQGQLPAKQLSDALETATFDFLHPAWTDTSSYRQARRVKRLGRGVSGNSK